MYRNRIEMYRRKREKNIEDTKKAPNFLVGGLPYY